MDAGDKDGSHLYITEDGGVNFFFKTQLPFQLTGDIEFYPRKSNENFLLASSAILSTKVQLKLVKTKLMKSLKHKSIVLNIN